LTAGTTYYVRAYATNSVGTSYGNEISFTTTAQPSYPAGTVNCGFVTEVVEIISPAGRIWMDRNLGASAVATSSTDANAFGDLYQWGRRTDGHQCRNVSTVSTAIGTSDIPSHSLFIQVSSSVSNSAWNWRTTEASPTLWQGINGTNNPCPMGFRLPTETEWQAEINALAPADRNILGFFNSTLKLTAASRRNSTNSFQNGLGSYWSSSYGSTYARGFTIVTSGGPGGNNAYVWDDYRANGYCVRCIKNQ
jgi:uncharacterized protein (TIGR02145 family)